MGAHVARPFGGMRSMKKHVSSRLGSRGAKRGIVCIVAALPLALGVSGLAGLVSCSGETTYESGLEIVVAAQGLRAGVDFDAFDVRVDQEVPATADSPARWDTKYDRPFLTSERALPRTFSLPRGSAPDQEVRITVRALAGGTAGKVLVTRVAQLIVPPDRVAELLMELSVSCLQVTCADPAQACMPNRDAALPNAKGTCQSIVVDGTQLPTYGAPAAALPDGGRDGGRDGTSDATVVPPDGGPPGDAQAADAREDAEAGAPPTCTGTEARCNAQQPQTCSAGLWVDTGAPCTGQACSAATGACLGVCEPGKTRCAVTGNAVETCAADGQWSAGVACVAQTCGAAGACQGECVAGAQRCDPAAGANAVQTCDANGTWGAAKACTLGVCDAATSTCRGSCHPGDAQCSGNGVQTCGGDGTLGAVTACSNQACIQSGTAASCQGSCAPGTTPACNGATPQRCSSTGVLTTSPVTSGQCGASCTPGATPACNGAAPQSCSSAGVLTTSPVTGGQCGASCTPGATPACNGATPQSCSGTGVLTAGAVTAGQCGAACTPGAAQCSAKTPQTCSAGGQWQNGTACSYFCSGAGTCNDCSTGTNGVACGADFACASGTCQDAEWAEWTMPNGAGQTNAPTYTNNGDGTVTDNVTGLMWQQPITGTTYTWAAAGAACASLTTGNHADWRLPTLIELVSLLEYATMSPAINTTSFPGTPSANFWTATAVPGAVQPYAWLIDFSAGYVSYDDATKSFNVRCVR